MTPHKNPFPVDRFIGRAAEVASVVSLVTATIGQSAAVIGEPRSGKTLLLRHLASPAVLAAEPGLLVAYVDAQTFDAAFDRRRFWTAVLGPLEATGLFEPAGAPLGAAYRACHLEGFATDHVERLLNALGAGGRRLVVVLDEFDYLVRRNITKRDGFFTGLRSLMGGAHRALSVIVASREQLASLEKLWSDKRAGGSPPFNLFTQILLEPFDTADIDTILDAAAASFSPADRRFLHDVSGGYAYLVQEAASALFAAAVADPAKRRRDTGQALLHAASQGFAAIWSAWPGATRHVFAAVAVEHLGALGPGVGWEQGVVPVVDPDGFPEEIHALTRHGFIAASAHTPGGYVVRPLVLLAWIAVKLRREARSTEEWTAWMDAEAWRKAWHLSAAVRVRIASIRTSLDILVDAHAALGVSTPVAWRRPSVPPLPGSLILHLSDLHFGTLADAELWYGQLAQDLRDQGCAQLDAVILSGDLANFSAPAEYDAARLFLDKLRAGFQLSPAQVIPVPGNHDLNWDLSRGAYQLARRSALKPAPPEHTFIEVSGDVIELRDEGLYRKRFDPFAAFYQAVRGDAYPLDPSDQALLYALPAPRILVLGLNSAWELDHHYKARAGIHPIALSRALERIHAEPMYEDFLKIAVWHHPVASAFEDRIKDHGFLERLAVAGFRLGLHGHIHKAQESLYRYDVSAGRRRLDLVLRGHLRRAGSGVGARLPAPVPDPSVRGPRRHRRDTPPRGAPGRLEARRPLAHRAGQRSRTEVHAPAARAGVVTGAPGQEVLQTTRASPANRVGEPQPMRPSRVP